MRTTPRRHDIAQEFVDREDAWQDFVEGHGRHRLVFEGRDRLLPELHLLGWLKFRRAMANALWPSQHRGFFEIHYIVHGNLHWWVEQQDYPLGPGMLLVIRPDELHGAQNAVLDPCEHYWIQIDLRTPKNLPGLQLKESREICELLATRRRAGTAEASRFAIRWKNSWKSTAIRNLSRSCLREACCINS